MKKRIVLQKSRWGANAPLDSPLSPVHPGDRRRDFLFYVIRILSRSGRRTSYRDGRTKRPGPIFNIKTDSGHVRFRAGPIAVFTRTVRLV